MNLYSEEISSNKAVIRIDVYSEEKRDYLVEDDTCLDEIRQGLEKKLDSLVQHELYGKFKTAPTQEEREKARQEYLDRRGVLDSFRW